MRRYSALQTKCFLEYLSIMQNTSVCVAQEICCESGFCFWHLRAFFWLSACMSGQESRFHSFSCSGLSKNKNLWWTAPISIVCYQVSGSESGYGWKKERGGILPVSAQAWLRESWVPSIWEDPPSMSVVSAYPRLSGFTIQVSAFSGMKLSSWSQSVIWGFWDPDLRFCLLLVKYGYDVRVVLK